jgi:hypothetical protein
MPNWFYFSLNVSGEKKDVEQFVENVKGSEKFDTEGREFDFNHFIPQPENIFRDNIGADTKNELNAKGIPNWYDWNNANWGTKWNAVCDDDFSSSGDRFPFEHEYNLRTAWAFPSPVIKKMIEMYPNLDFVVVGEEESQEYGVYVDSSTETWQEEEPSYVDEHNGLEVYYSPNDQCWRYLESNEAVEDSDDFFPQTKYSWS